MQSSMEVSRLPVTQLMTNLDLPSLSLTDRFLCCDAIMGSWVRKPLAVTVLNATNHPTMSFLWNIVRMAHLTTTSKVHTIFQFIWFTFSLLGISIPIVYFIQYKRVYNLLIGELSHSVSTFTSTYILIDIYGWLIFYWKLYYVQFVVSDVNLEGKVKGQINEWSEHK